MRLLVTSAARANGDGYGALLAFDRAGRPRGVFSDDARIADPRGLATENETGLLFLNSGVDRVVALDARAKIVRDTGPIGGLNPGAGVFGPDHRYYVGLRGARTIMALRSALDAAGELVLAPGIVPFPRGFAFGRDGRLFLASGVGPNGEGDDTIVAVSRDGGVPSAVVQDPELSPLDLVIAPNGNIVVSSERPFGAPETITTVREYGPGDRRPLQVLSPDGRVSQAARTALCTRRESLLRRSG